MRLIRKSDMVQGRWRNGMGVSWDIADWPEGAGAGDFGWRFALARIDADVPFSRYPGIDRYFTLVDGDGLDLEFSGSRPLAVGKPHVPHFYPCDVDTFCRLRGGPCLALNLFLKRGAWTARIDIVQGEAILRHDGPILFYALDGEAAVNGQALASGDAAVADTQAAVSAGRAHLYVARLSG